MTRLYKWNIVKLPAPAVKVTELPPPTLAPVLPAGLPLIFFDPRAEGLNAAWVLRLMATPAPQPTTAEGWLALYLKLRAAVREAFCTF